MFKKWTYKLLIENTLDRDLILINKTCPYGKLKCADEEIPANGGRGTVEIISPAGAPYGLQISVTYGDKHNKDEISYGTFTVNIEVPLIEDNKSSCETTGIIMVDGFNELPKRGHDFQQSVTITSKL